MALSMAMWTPPANNTSYPWLGLLLVVKCVHEMDRAVHEHEDHPWMVGVHQRGATIMGSSHYSLSPAASPGLKS